MKCTYIYCSNDATATINRQPICDRCMAERKKFQSKLQSALKDRPITETIVHLKREV